MPPAVIVILAMGPVHCDEVLPSVVTLLKLPQLWPAQPQAIAMRNIDTTMQRMGYVEHTVFERKVGSPVVQHL